ncbi:MFS transporter [Kushneria phosphatilytica]|uniref:Uncharacterized MFS-type transporter FY550_09590 n=1 Tax=Kushneria phosphatilytica TaxID=657387 RepID=A0A1S1NX68_9GAMM|nr:MFS transporter [Kushneria phosphatilytica]OHV12172.1 MFS transporter [Kushneria phosphatilytica]QEL11366.1 MFS transporter [Kushneria phosphatilytica]
MSSESDPSRTSLKLKLQIITIVSSTFVSMLCIGMTLTVLPPWLAGKQGFSAVTVGVVISAQFVATLLSRPFAGQLADRLGAKRIVMAGMAGCSLNGLLVVLAVTLQAQPLISLLILLFSRLILGVAQGMIGTGSLSWGIGLVGPVHMSRVISWNGIAGFGALAIGAPLGALIVDLGGVGSVGIVIALLALTSLAMAWRRPASPVIAGKRMPFSRVFGRVAPFGLGLALSSIGYGVIATFITLYFAAEQWDHAAWGLAVFGISFIIARLLFAGSIGRFGGYPVALVCFGVESLGLLLLWLADSAVMAMAGASLTGLGVSLIFPALGVVAVNRIDAASRSAALGAYSVFLDAAVGVTGPLAGFIAGHAGYSAIFLCAALSACSGGALCLLLYQQSRRLAATERQAGQDTDLSRSSPAER